MPGTYVFTDNTLGYSRSTPSTATTATNLRPSFSAYRLCGVRLYPAPQFSAGGGAVSGYIADGGFLRWGAALDNAPLETKSAPVLGTDAPRPMVLTPPKNSSVGFWNDVNNLTGLSVFEVDLPALSAYILDYTIEFTMPGTGQFSPLLTTTTTQTAGITYQLRPVATGSGTLGDEAIGYDGAVQ